MEYRHNEADVSNGLTLSALSEFINQNGGGPAGVYANERKAWK